MNTNNTRINKTITKKNKNGKKNNSMDISSNKQAKISPEKIWTWVRKGKLKRETESFLIAAQNNAKRTNYIKAKVEKLQQNSKCSLCNDRDETINYISKCSKLMQKEYKTRDNWWGGDLLGIVQEV